MRIVFVCYTNYINNSAIQMFHLANALVLNGHEVSCVTPGPLDTVHNCGKPLFSLFDVDDVMSSNARALNVLGSIDVVHAWTPRECVRKPVEMICVNHQCKYYVHLEDNERYISAAYLRVADHQLELLDDEYATKTLGDRFTHPKAGPLFIAGAAGVSILIEKLAEFVPHHIPTAVFYPSCNESTFNATPIDFAKRRSMGIEDEDFLIVYNGNAHFANKHDMKGLYLAIGLANIQDNRRKTKLLRVGATIGVDLFGEAREACEPHIIDLGSRPHHEQPGYLSLANCLVQPGRPSAFNDYRFPSKLPEFFRMERPVILPRSNIGLRLEDRKHCLIMQEGTALELSRKIAELRNNNELCMRMVDNMKSFSKKNLSWAAAANIIEQLYAASRHQNMLITTNRFNNIH